jgi:hypothetical protein
MGTSFGIDVGSIVQSRRQSYSSSNSRVMKVAGVLGIDWGPLGFDDDTLELVWADECVAGLRAPEGGRGMGLWNRVDFQGESIVVIN